MSAVDAEFLRREQAETLPPPISSVGIIAWARAKLFSSIPNTIMTLAALAFVIWILPPILNFLLLDAVWTGSNRDSCLADKVGHPVGACWTFIITRIQYFIYGQYPGDERWRVNLTGALAVIGAVWLLVPRIGAKGWGGAYFFVVFPLVGFWLLTGGWGLTPVATNLWGGILVTL